MVQSDAKPNLARNTNTTLSSINTPEWPNSHTLKIQDGDGRHLNFGKMSITLDWIQISAPNYMGRCTTAMQKWPHDRKSKPEVNSCDVIKWTSGA